MKLKFSETLTAIEIVWLNLVAKCNYVLRYIEKSAEYFQLPQFIL